MNEIILLIIIGLAAGMLGGLFGVGGGIIVIPALMYLLGMTQHQAQGTSVAFMLLPVGLLAFIHFGRFFCYFYDFIFYFCSKFFEKCSPFL